MLHRNVTLRDVANEAGVHPATASRALNPDKRLLVNAETVERVTAAARRLGYVANPLAKALRGGTSLQVGVMVRTLHHPWVGYFLQGADEALSAAGYNIWITYSGEGDPDRITTLISAITNWRAGGLIIGTGEVTDEMITQAVAAGMPVVLVARTAIDQVCSAVDADNEGGARSAVAHLMRLGHRRIATIAGPQSVPIFRARLRGFRAAMEEAELRADPRVVKIADGSDIEDGLAACRQLLATVPEVTAISAGNDHLAVGCLRALEEAGLRCPEDISVIGFDDLPLTAQLRPALTTMHFPSREMGAEAAKLMLAQISGEAPSIRTVLIGTELVPRESTAKPRDLGHASVGKNLRSRVDLGHTDVVKNQGPAGCYDGAAGNRSERGTRGQVARLILELGPSTAATLGSRLGLTPAAIRRHLDNLIAEGMITTRTARAYGNRGRGRPAKVFVITDAGRSAFEHAYDDLATSALRFLAEAAGPEAVAEFARRQVAELETRYAPVAGVDGLSGRVKALAEALSADGYAASAGPAPSGEQICQHHCPVAHVAAEFPQLCEAETEAFARLLGTPVQRLATIAHGDGICTTHVTDGSRLGGMTPPAAVVAQETVVAQENRTTEESGGLTTS